MKSLSISAEGARARCKLCPASHLRAIEREPLDAYEYTARGNLVVAISNSTAILHLGNRNALAGHGWPDAARSG